MVYTVRRDSKTKTAASTVRQEKEERILNLKRKKGQGTGRGGTKATVTQWQMQDRAYQNTVCNINST